MGYSSDIKAKPSAKLWQLATPAMWTAGRNEFGRMLHRCEMPSVKLVALVYQFPGDSERWMRYVLDVRRPAINDDDRRLLLAYAPSVKAAKGIFDKAWPALADAQP